MPLKSPDRGKRLRAFNIHSTYQALCARASSSSRVSIRSSPVQVLEASPKGHYTQLVVQPLGWYNEPLTVVMHGDDAPQRGERLFVGLQHARLYNGDERIETRDEELALAQSA